jgi:hypothetical protein
MFSDQVLPDTFRADRAGAAEHMASATNPET